MALSLPGGFTTRSSEPGAARPKLSPVKALREVACTVLKRLSEKIQESKRRLSWVRASWHGCGQLRTGWATQSYLVILSHIQPYTSHSVKFSHSHIYSFSVIFSHIHSYSVIFGHIWSYSVIFSLFSHIQSYSGMVILSHFELYLLMVSHILSYLVIFQSN